METPVQKTHPTPTLDDCALEPIHIPGAIQAHGALLVLQDDKLVAWSANAPDLLPGNYRLDIPLEKLELPVAAVTGLSDLLAEARLVQGFNVSDEIQLNDNRYTRLVHCYDGRDLIEFEHQVDGKKIFDLSSRLQMKLRSNPDALHILSECTAHLRAWTGFDRVMTYVFQPDGSGDVVAEARGEGIDSFLNMRFPASDIPAQARRLYTLNTLRLIPDVNYVPVALLGSEEGAPVDLSFAALRSVSPIHIEYLQNMGVSASMSVSIVVNGELWGLFACHHHSPLFVSEDIRQACAMLALFVSSRIQAIEAAAEAKRQQECAETITQIAGALISTEDPLVVLSEHRQLLQQVLRADALILTYQGKILEFGGVSRLVSTAILSHLTDLNAELHAIDDQESWPESMRALLEPWVGALNIVFDRPGKGHIVALRRAQIYTVRWGGEPKKIERSGEPEKIYKTGAHGVRLTPRGSFAEWRETIRGRSQPWLPATLRLASQLQHELSRICTSRYAEIEEARQHLLAMLGHDLRDPLQAIRMAANALKLNDTSREWGARIDNSSGRMQRLITQILDFSRAQAGMPLLGAISKFDLSQVLQELVDEVCVAHPGVEYRLNVERPAMWEGDPERIAQALSNLLSNARHHGAIGKPIDVSLNMQDDTAVIEIANTAPPIPADIVDELFVPYKPRRNQFVNRNGLGLGLYIANQIAKASGGNLEYAYRREQVIFTMRLNIVKTKPL